MPTTQASPPRKPLAEVLGLFLRLGVTAFGGPAAHVAMMRDEVVTRRRWLTDQEFLDLVGATNLIPGPNSTEMAIHIGYRRAGRAGLVAAGAAFIFPAMLIVMALAWVYVTYGATPQASWLLYGVKPVIIAIIAQALWSLGRTALKDVLTVAAGGTALVLYALGVNEIALLAAAGLVVMLVRNAGRARLAGAALMAGGMTVLCVRAAVAAALTAGAAAAAFSIERLFFMFLKIGSVLYGSGYVLLAFLRADFVERLGWLSDQQLLDAVSIGQFTPGPVFTTATFVGYLLGGVPAAVVATVAIFLPSFVFVAATHPIIPRLRRSAWAGAALDGVNAASLALMAGVTWKLGHAAIVDPLTAVLAVAALITLIRWKINSAWLVLAGAVAGLAARGLGL